MNATIQKEAEQLVQKAMDTYADPSHDFAHVQRVVRLAKHIASTHASVKDDEDRLLLVWLVALFHDVGDHKYEGGAEKTAEAKRFLSKNFSITIAEQVLSLCANVSWSKEQKLIAAGKSLQEQVSDFDGDFDVLCIVQDADRLDAIGAIGIGRTFAFGGKRSSPLSAQREHFDDKLLKIAAVLKTDEGRRLSAERQQIMERFCEQFDREVNGD